jgi:hypothetical protein
LNQSEITAILRRNKNWRKSIKHCIFLNGKNHPTPIYRSFLATNEIRTKLLKILMNIKIDEKFEKK